MKTHNITSWCHKMNKFDTHFSQKIVYKKECLPPNCLDASLPRVQGTHM